MVSFVIQRKRSLALIRHNAAQLCSLPTFIGTKPCDFGKKDIRHCATFPSGEGLRFIKRCLEKISFGLFLQSERIPEWVSVIHGADNLCSMFRSVPSRLLWRVRWKRFICSLAKNVPPARFLNARLQIRLTARVK